MMSVSLEATIAANVASTSSPDFCVPVLMATSSLRTTQPASVSVYYRNTLLMFTYIILFTAYQTSMSVLMDCLGVARCVQTLREALSVRVW